MDSLLTDVKQLDSYLRYLMNGHKKLTGPMREALKNKVKDLKLHFELKEVNEKQVLKIIKKLKPHTTDV